jgi:hypothetical protein
MKLGELSAYRKQQAIATSTENISD